MIGTTVGKYRIIGQLGRGGTGMVYRAVDETLGREVAVKTLNGGLGETDILKRFRAEATILARLNHPEIATIYELFRSETDLLMVMELVRGETLEQLASRVGTLSPTRAASLSGRILSALEYAHRAGVVHRDMKPANVMVTEGGGVKIMDFGVARVCGGEHMTMDGYVVGTPAYMAPEQVLAQEVDGRADLYSVGVVLYRLLTGALPFQADTPAAMLHQQIAEAPTPLSQHRDDLPEWCETVVQRALAKSPAARFQTAAEFRRGARSSPRHCDDDRSRQRRRWRGRSGSRHTGSRRDTCHFTNRGRTASGARGQQNHILATHTSGDERAADRRSGSRCAGEHEDWPAEKVSGAGGSLLAVLAVSATIVAYVALDKAETAPERRTTATSPAKVFPALVFRTKTLAGAGGRQRERDARLVLAEGTITVTADDDTGDRLHTVAYDSVLSINYSRGVDPMWIGPDGPAVVARAPIGALRRWGVSIERHWISLRTNTENRFVILRVDEAQVRRMLSALEERTGRRTARSRPAEGQQVRPPTVSRTTKIPFCKYHAKTA